MFRPRARRTDSLSRQRQRRECTSAARHGTARREMRWHERGRNVQRHRPRVLNERDEITDDALRQGKGTEGYCPPLQLPRKSARQRCLPCRMRNRELLTHARTGPAVRCGACLPDRSGARGCSAFVSGRPIDQRLERPQLGRLGRLVRPAAQYRCAPLHGRNECRRTATTPHCKCHRSAALQRRRRAAAHMRCSMR
jgi:hypothetical protein